MTLTKTKESSIKSSAKNNHIANDKRYLAVFTLVIAVTVATRFYKVTEPDHVW